MNAPTQELMHRKHLVFHGLKDALPEDVVQYAVKLCEHEFAGGDYFSAYRFVNRLAQKVPSVKPHAMQLFQALNRLQTQNGGPKSVVQEPIPAVPPETLTPLPAAPGSGWPIVFNTLLREILTQLRQVNPKLVSQTLQATHDANPKLSPPVRNEFLDFVTNGTAQFTTVTPTTDMHTIVHTVYQALCDDHGPVAADRLLTRAVQATEKLPLAAVHPPRALL